jgi:outer membrane protein OmpA-like peptidoglycan-associated protein
MPRHATRSIALVTIMALAALAQPVEAQLGGLGRRIGRAAERAVERETEREVDRRVTNAMRCAFDDTACQAKAKADGKDVEYVDDQGRVITGKDGKPVTDPAEAAKATAVRPGEGAWANWDFVPGDTVLYLDDYSKDRVGDFPRRWELIEGNFEIVEWQGSRFVRVTSDGVVVIPLPRTLPERFTIEFAVSVQHGNARAVLATGPIEGAIGRTEGDRFDGTLVQWAHSRAGVRPTGKLGPEVMTPVEWQVYKDRVVPVRIMADGKYMKVYWDDRRVANVPNAIFPRSDKLYLAMAWTSIENPGMIGPMRVAGGGLDLYDQLARDGRVATQGILFATGSDRLRPESTPVLKEIVDMMQEHTDLTLRIEGHTDDVGDDASNQELSERRAAAVKAWLVESGRIAAGRLVTAGLGESKPAVQGTSPEAREQNRRVELIDTRSR